MLEKKKLNETTGSSNNASNSGMSGKSPIPVNDLSVSKLTLNANASTSSFKSAHNGKPIGTCKNSLSNTNTNTNSNNINNNNNSINSSNNDPIGNKISSVLNNGLNTSKNIIGSNI